MKADEPSGTVLFEEQQRPPRWIGLILLISMIATVAGLLIGFFIEKDKPEMLLALALVVPVMLLVIYLHFNLQLEKTVTSNGLYYRWKPWHRKFRVIEKQDIASVMVRKLPIMNFGFGRYPGYGRYHNSSRGEGLQLMLKNSSRIYFSTYDIASFKKAMNTLIDSK